MPTSPPRQSLADSPTLLTNVEFQQSQYFER